jgi:hypothetical protein
MFLVFAYNVDNSRGGWSDFQFSSKNIEELRNKIKFDKDKEKFIVDHQKFDRFQVVDVATLEEIDTDRWAYSDNSQFC